MKNRNSIKTYILKLIKKEAPKVDPKPIVVKDVNHAMKVINNGR